LQASSVHASSGLMPTVPRESNRKAPETSIHQSLFVFDAWTRPNDAKF